MLKDKSELLAGVSRFLPKNRILASRVWNEMQQQIANYIHGKLLEILIVGVVTYIIFLSFGFKLSAVAFCCRWVICLSSLYRRGIGDDSRRFSGDVPVWNFPKRFGI